MKKAIILLAEGFEEIEALSVVDVFRRADIICDMCSLGNTVVAGGHGIEVKTDHTFDKVDFKSYDILILPGGMKGTLNLAADERVIKLVRQYNKENKIIASICAAPIVLKRAGIIDKKRITSYPSIKDKLEGCLYVEELTSCDENIITSRGPATSLYFAFEILKKIGLEDIAKQIKNEMLLEFVECKARE